MFIAKRKCYAYEDKEEEEDDKKKKKKEQDKKKEQEKKKEEKDKKEKEKEKKKEDDECSCDGNDNDFPKNIPIEIRFKYIFDKYNDFNDPDYDPNEEDDEIDNMFGRKHKKSVKKIPEEKREKIIVDANHISSFLKEIDIPVKKIDDLILIGKSYANLQDKYPTIIHDDIKDHISEYKFSSIIKVNKMLPELTEMAEMIGLGKIKEQFVAQVAYLLSNHKQEMLMHTIICGDPGTGKTTIAKLIGKAYHKSGILTSNAFVCATRKQLVGKYLGHTAPQTTEMFDKARGGVIFIDEIYSLGNNSDSGNDSFSKEAIDTINQLLSERTDTMCIIAGYADDTENHFLTANQGLTSRFPWRFDIDKYSSDDMFQMFNLYVKRGNWVLDDECKKYVNAEWFKTNEKYFQYFGRDINSFLTKCYIQHSLRLFLEDTNKILTVSDLKNGFKVYSENRKVHKEDDSHKPYHSMYT